MRYIIIALLMFGCKKEEVKKEEVKPIWYEVTKIGNGSIVWSAGNLHTDFCCLKDGQIITRGILNGSRFTATADTGEVLVRVNGLTIQGQTISFK
jgi:hypothetical protein